MLAAAFLGLEISGAGDSVPLPKKVIEDSDPELAATKQGNPSDDEFGDEVRCAEM